MRRCRTRHYIAGSVRRKWRIGRPVIDLHQEAFLEPLDNKHFSIVSFLQGLLEPDADALGHGIVCFDARHFHFDDQLIIVMAVLRQRLFQFRIRAIWYDNFLRAGLNREAGRYARAVEPEPTPLR